MNKIGVSGGQLALALKSPYIPLLKQYTVQLYKGDCDIGVMELDFSISAS